jgi:flagellar protein FlaG
MSSSINEIVTPVIGYFRNAVSSGVSKPNAGNSAEMTQRSNEMRSSPGNLNRVENENGNSMPSGEAIEKALAKAQELARSFSRTLSFSYDDRIDKVIVRVMEGNGEKVVRQIPPEEMIRLSLKMDEIMGMLINQDA